MLDSENNERRYPIETEEALIELEMLAANDPDLALVLRRVKAFAELKHRGDRKKIEYTISNCFADTVCWNFAEYVKTGYLFFGVHGAEKELGEDISLFKAKEKWGFPFVVRFYRDKKKVWEDLILKWRKEFLIKMEYWKIPLLKELEAYMPGDLYKTPNVPEELWDKIRTKVKSPDVFDSIRTQLMTVVLANTDSYEHAGIIVGENDEGFIMLDKSGHNPVRMVNYEDCSYTQQADFVLCEGFDIFNSREQEIVEAGFHESQRDRRGGRALFDSRGRRIES